MRSERLLLALDTGAIELPATGDILVLRPRAEDDLQDLPKSRLVLVTGFKPDYDSFEKRGYRVAAKAEGPYATTLVCLPRSREMARALLAEAAALTAPEGQILVDGQKTDGVEAVFRELRDKGADLGAVTTKAHGRIFSLKAGLDLSDWHATPSETEGFTTQPGVFSADGPDRASVLLAATLPAKLSSRVIDLGAGWGYLSRAILARKGVETLDLVEAEALSLDCAKHNIQDPRARFHWANATTWKPAIPAQTVISNPPFHNGRDADPALGMAFIRAASMMLTTSGSLWLVANRHLPYDKTLNDHFKEVEDIGNDRSFRIIRASRPIQGPPRK